MIDITGIDKPTLLFNLWKYAKSTSLAVFIFEEAQEAINRGHINYFCGRCIKMDLSGNIVDETEYDIFAESLLTAKAIVRKLRAV